jgi:hypothetical protein
VRPDPRCEAIARRQRSLGLYAEVVQITAVLPNYGQIVCKMQRGNRKTFTITNPALIDRLTTRFVRASALPSPAVLYAQSRAELLTDRFYVWLPDEGVSDVEGKRAASNRRADRLRVQRDTRRETARGARRASSDRLF